MISCVKVEPLYKFERSNMNLEVAIIIEETTKKKNKLGFWRRDFF